MAGGKYPQLVDVVRDRIIQDGALPAAVAELIIDAFGSVAQPVESATSSMSGLFLRDIAVSGFRGIGPAVTLSLPPGPGLTLVVGRNGAGKSSFAEAAELAWTGTSKRWDGRATSAWREGWRNVHDADSCRIRLELTGDGDVGGFSIDREWSRSDTLDQGSWTQQRGREPAVPFDSAYWKPRLQLYRPFLSYSELGSLIDGRPSELYDAIHQLLGLDDLAAARKAITERRKELDRVAKNVRTAKDDLVPQLKALDDDRARIAAGILASGHPDLSKLAEVAAGKRADVSGLADLRAMTSIRVPERVDVENIAMRIRTAADALVRAATDEADASSRAMGLLRAAVEHYRTNGECQCPVCGTGRLDEEWSVVATERITRCEEQSAVLRQANARLAAAEKDARDLIERSPAALRTLVPGVDSSDALACWNDWAAVPDAEGHAELADRLVTSHRALSGAVGALRDMAAAELGRRDEQWAPLARQLATWHDDAQVERAQADELKALKKAESWLKATQAELQNERVRPFAAQSKRVWRLLGQHSNVQLGDLTLSGTTTTRHVAMNVTVDDEETSALAVMSQGELHAFGLSLFLPRATVDDSPFRFVVIDDPVQAMDPVRVDGLARVLAETAEHRQVVVFSHDERLPEAVRRLSIDATVFEVTRAQRSVVEVHAARDPIERYLDDARALADSPGVPEDLRKELIATCCRSALEAASHSKVRASLLRRGVPHAEVEQLLAAAFKTHQKVALAVFGQPGREGDLLRELNRLGRWAADTLQACKQGAHRGINRDLGGLIDDTRRLTQWLIS